MKHNLIIPCPKRDANEMIKRGSKSSSPRDLHAQFIDPLNNHTSHYNAIKMCLWFALLKINQSLSCLYSTKIQYVIPYDYRTPSSPLYLCTLSLTDQYVYGCKLCLHACECGA